MMREYGHWAMYEGEDSDGTNVRWDEVKSTESETSNQMSRWDACAAWILFERKIAAR